MLNGIICPATGNLNSAPTAQKAGDAADNKAPLHNHDEPGVWPTYKIRFTRRQLPLPLVPVNSTGRTESPEGAPPNLCGQLHSARPQQPVRASRLAKSVHNTTLCDEMDPKLTEYDCTQCGACCRSFPIFASEADAVREPMIRQEARRLPEHLETTDKAYQLFPLPFHTRCPYLKDDELCRIYQSRPSVCRQFESGSEQCIEARRRQGIQSTGT